MISVLIKNIVFNIIDISKNNIPTDIILMITYNPNSIVPAHTQANAPILSLLLFALFEFTIIFKAIITILTNTKIPPNWHC